MKITTPSGLSVSLGLRPTYGIIWEVANLIQWLMKACGGDISTPEWSHKRIDELLNNHGIESARFKVKGKVRTLYYSNVGDAYKPTVMRWEWKDGLSKHVVWLVGCWGDIAEKYQEAE
jgi:hypothetical protein